MRIALVLALGVSVATCRLDKLINPATADRLTVSPSAIDTSAHVGSIGTGSVTLRVATADGAALSWTATKSAVWLALSSFAGTTPDSVIVTFDPDTLSQTLHQDTIRFVRTGSTDTIKVPLTLDMLAPAPELAVTPASDAETLFVGSAVPDTFTLWIRNTGGLPLTWTAAADTGWVSLSDSGSTVPAQDSISVTVTLTGDGLAAGTHHGSISVSAPGAVPPQASVPVNLTVQPCTEAPITLDTVVTGAIALSDCGAPQRAGRQAKLYAVQANAGDTLLIRLNSAAFDAYLILTNTSGVALLDSSDACGVQTGPACLNFIVSNAARYVIEATTKDSGATGAFTLSAARGLTPNPPSAVGQFRANGTTAITVGAVTPESTVVFKATVNDPNPGDSVHLEVEVEGLTTGTQPLHVSPSVPPGTPLALSVSGFADDEGYHWRARTCDQTGRCSTWFNFGGNVDPAVDFFVNSKPEAPEAPGSPDQFNGVGTTPMPPGGGTGGGLGSNQTVTFRALVTDFDPGDMISLEVEVKDVGAPFDGLGTTLGVAVPSGSTAAVSVVIQAPLLGQTNFYWRVRACDQLSQCGAWVSFGGTGGDSPPRATDFHVP